MPAIKWEKRKTGLPLRFPAVGYKYNKYNVGGESNSWGFSFGSFFFSFSYESSWEKSPTPGFNDILGDIDLFELANSKFPCHLSNGLTSYYILL